MKEKDFIRQYLLDVEKVAKVIDQKAIERTVSVLKEIKRKRGRVFVLGVGGGAGNATHAVNDLRKIAGIEAYAPTDNVSELTARVNDEGWEQVFVQWLKTSALGKNDCVFVFSVGGGNLLKSISTNIAHALTYAKKTGAKIVGIVGKDGGYTAKVADAAVIIPVVNKDAVTPLTESFQSVICHLLVTHPGIKSFETKWESQDRVLK